MDISATITIALTKFSAFLPALIGTVGAWMLNPPKTKAGAFGITIFSFGCGIYGYGLVHHYLPWLGAKGAMLATASIAWAVLVMIGAGLKKFDLNSVVSAWLPKNKGQ